MTPETVARTVTANNPAAGAVTGASLEFVYQGGYKGQVMYVLELKGAEPKRIVLEQLYTGGFPGELSSEETEKMRPGPERIDFAPDGHAIAIARAGEVARRYIALDAGTAPLYCRHVTFGSPTDPFDGAPRTRDLALAILATPKGGAHDTDPSNDSQSHFESELAVAASYACAHPDDAPFPEAVAKALVMPGGRLFSTRTVEPIADCAGDLAREHVEARNVLVAAVGSQDEAMTSQVSRAAIALARGTDARAEDAIATELRSPAASRVVPNDTSCWMRSSLAWSLAKMTAARPTTTPAASTLDALVDVAIAPEPCKDGYGASAARVDAVRALAGVTSPRAVDALRTLAKGTCTHPINAWPATFERANESFGPSQEIACWAQAALARVAK